jgi:GATA-binding protein
MAARIASPLATATPQQATKAMKPTTTEHDFRFPRRPFDSPAAGSGTGTDNSRTANPSDGTSPGELRMQELQLDLSNRGRTAQHDLLSSSAFPPWQDEMATKNNESLEQMQQNDPLATQIWRFFSKTKQSLPSQERMENLTWRMMHMRLRKLQEEENARYVGCICAHREFSNTSSSLGRPTESSANNAPSGIAQQLRKVSTQNVIPSEPMNIDDDMDDFIFSDKLSTPAGIMATPSPEALKQTDEKAAHASAAAIPIKSRKPSQQHFAPQSVPVAPHPRNQDEFGYVTRHPRKTSIDERRVSGFENDALNLHICSRYVACFFLRRRVAAFIMAGVEITNTLRADPKPQTPCQFLPSSPSCK